MDFYYNIVSSSPAAGYDGPDFVTANDDSNYESDTHTYQESLISIPDSTQSEEESEGGLFVEQERSVSPASAITVASLSASASASEQEDSSSEISSSPPASESSSEAESDRDYFFDNDRADVDWEQALERELEAQPDDHSIGGDSEGTVHQPDPDALHPRLNEHRHPFLLEEDLQGQPGLIEVEDYDVDENEDEEDLDAFEGGLVDLAVVRLHVEEEEEDDGGDDGGDDDDDEVDDLQAEARSSFAQQFPHHHHHHHRHHHHHHHHLHHHHAQQRPPTLRFSSLLDVRNLGPRSASPAQLESPHRMPGMADELIGVELGGGGGGGRNSRARASQNQPRRAEPNVIDLTLEDDDELELLGESVGESQNARRQQSQRRSNAPRLNRSDGSYVGNQNVIELSSDDENDNTVAATRARRAPPAHLHNNNNNHQNRNRHQHHHQHQHNNFHRINIGAIPAMAARNHNERFAQFLMGIGGDVNNAANDHNVLGMNVRPPGFPPNLHLDYQAVAFAAQPRPAPPPAAGPRKPDHDPPSKPRDGFTRDTNEDNVVICPSCDEELAFDPDGGDENGPPTKRARNKKDQAEHHFWAIKECGHVFCRRCYENRKPTAKNPVKVGFKACPSNGKRIICAVDNCTSDVTTKTSWVGLFL